MLPKWWNFANLVTLHSPHLTKHLEVLIRQFEGDQIRCNEPYAFGRSVTQELFLIIHTDAFYAVR